MAHIIGNLRRNKGKYVYEKTWVDKLQRIIKRDCKNCKRIDDTDCESEPCISCFHNPNIKTDLNDHYDSKSR